MYLLRILKKKLCSIVILIALPAHIVLAADLIFSSPPREPEAAGKELYQPIADYLSRVLNRKVIYQHPGNWFNYQNKMKKDAYDIIFDGPHFVSWRIAHLEHQALVKLPGSLKFIVVVDTDNNEINKPEDVIGKNFCGISPPNLSSLTFLQTFSNPVTQPKVYGIKGGMNEVLIAFNNDKCPAAVIRKTYYKTTLTKAQRRTLKIIFNSDTLPNQAISVSNRLTLKEKRKITRALTNGEGVILTRALVKRFVDNKTTSSAFIKTSNTEYLGYNRYLEGVLFGW